MRGLADEVLEGLGRHEAGAGAGHEEAARGDELHGEHVEVVVFLEALGLELDVAAVDELGRVAEDQVPRLAVLLHLADPGEGVGVDELDARVVQVGVPLGHLDGLLVEVDRGDLGGPGELGGDGEPAGVAAQVEHPQALGEGAEAAAVIALVAEEARLVALGEVDLLDHAELLDLHEADGRLRDVRRHDPLDAGDMRVHLDDLALGADGVVQDRDPAGEAAHDRVGRDLDREDVAQPVDDQAGKEVGVGVHDAVGVGDRVQLEHVLAEGGGAADGLFEPGVIRLARGGLENAERDGRARVPEAVADEGALLVVGRHEVALAGVGGDVAHHRAEDRGLGREGLELHPWLLARDRRGDVGEATEGVGHGARFASGAGLASLAHGRTA